MLNRSGVQNSYNKNVKIGNWAEDQEYSRLSNAAYLQQKESGGLLVHKVQAHLQKSLTPVDLSASPDGMLRLGDNIMLYSVRTKGVLSVDTSERIKSSDEGYSLTTSTNTQAHVARNVFTIEGYGTGSQKGDVLKLGDQFRLRCHASLTANPIYLHSQPISTTSASKVSRKQEVCAYAHPCYDTVWSVQFKDITKRFEMHGQPVPANAEVVLEHASTGSALSSDVKPYHNDFGAEYEVCCGTKVSTGKRQVLRDEHCGTLTGDMAAKPEQAANWFAFLTAGAEE